MAKSFGEFLRKVVAEEITLWEDVTMAKNYAKIFGGSILSYVEETVGPILNNEALVKHIISLGGKYRRKNHENETTKSYNIREYYKNHFPL